MRANGLAEFDRWMEGRGRSPYTRYGYLLDIQQFARWLAGQTGEQLSPEVVTTSNVQEFRRHVVSARGDKPRTFNRKLAALRAYVLWAQREGVIEADPLEGMHVMPEQRASPRWLNPVEINAMKHAARQLVEESVGHSNRVIAIRDRAMFLTILEMGLRLGELCALNLNDIEITKNSGVVHILTGNVVRPRTITVPSTAHSHILEWLGRRPETKSKAFFTNITLNTRLSRRSAQARIRAIAKWAGVNASSQVLRHTFAKNLIKSGLCVEDAAVLLGHSYLYTTRLYTNSDQ